ERVTKFLSVIAVASLPSGLLLHSKLSVGQTPSAPPATKQPLSSLTQEAWHATMARIRHPKPGCFKATYPDTEWQEVACTTAPNGTYAPAQGSNDFAAEVVGTISSAVGSFDDYAAWSPNNLGRGTPSVEYSLQLNTNFFTTSLCNGSANPAN